MTLSEAFRIGGLPFMVLITIIGLLMIVFVVKNVLAIINKNYRGKGLNYILMFGSLAFIIGLLGQAIGMVGAFDAIQTAGDISPGLIAGGLRVSMIAPMYGLIIFIISIPAWVVIKEILKSKN